MKKVSEKKIKEEKDLIIKYGFCNGVQIYKNKTKNKYFLETKQPRRLSEDKFILVMKLFKEGMSFRGIGRVVGCHHITARNWILKEAERLQKEPLFVDVADEQPIVEMDEMHSFIKKK